MDIAPTNGRSEGVIKPPDVPSPAPELSDEEVQQAMAEIGLTKISARQLKSMRKLGQATKELGAISIGRGVLMMGLTQLVETAERAKELEKDENSWEGKAAFLRVRRDCAQGVVSAGKVIIESELQKPKEIAQEQPFTLPEFGQEISPSLTLIKADNVHVNG